MVISGPTHHWTLPLLLTVFLHLSAAQFVLLSDVCHFLLLSYVLQPLNSEYDQSGQVCAYNYLQNTWSCTYVEEDFNSGSTVSSVFVDREGSLYWTSIIEATEDERSMATVSVVRQGGGVLWTFKTENMEVEILGVAGGYVFVFNDDKVYRIPLVSLNNYKPEVVMNALTHYTDFGEHLLL